MKEIRLLMGMPITVEIAGLAAEALARAGVDKAFDYFKYVDEKFSPFKKTSEVSKINSGEVGEKNFSSDMRTIFELAEKTKKETDGYFDITDNKGKCNPSGLVKGWAIYNAAQLLKKMGFENFYVEAGGDIQVYGKNAEKKAWCVGIRNPFKKEEIVKTVYLGDNQGIATSGTYIRGQHIYNPQNRKEKLDEIVSISVIGPNVYEADRFATAVFAMQREGINFIENLNGFEGYMIDKNGIATMTSNFEKYV
jgi:thiamine biosynthesis lipoprotein